MTDVQQEDAAVVFRLRAFVREEEGLWVALCPSLDLAPQGETESEAKSHLQEAIGLWVDSCLERNTLSRAMEELGWHRVPAGMSPPGETECLDVALGSAGVLGEPFPLELRIPAYQASHYSAGRHAARELP